MTARIHNIVCYALTRGHMAIPIHGVTLLTSTLLYSGWVWPNFIDDNLSGNCQLKCHCILQSGLLKYNGLIISCFIMPRWIEAEEVY